MSSNGSKVIGMILTLGLTAMAIGFLIAMTEEAHSIRDPTPVFGMLAGGVIFAVLLRGPVGRAIAAMLEGHSGVDEGLATRVEQLEAQLNELGYDQQRVAELEERLDFAERLLSQRDKMGALNRPEAN